MTPRIEVRMLIRAIDLQLGEGQSRVDALNDVLANAWTSSIRDGRTVVSSQEAGGSVTFTFDRGFTPMELAMLATEALEWLEAEPWASLGVVKNNRVQATFRLQVP